MTELVFFDREALSRILIQKVEEMGLSTEGATVEFSFSVTYPMGKNAARNELVFEINGMKVLIKREVLR